MNICVLLLIINPTKNIKNVYHAGVNAVSRERLVKSSLYQPCRLPRLLIQRPWTSSLSSVALVVSSRYPLSFAWLLSQGLWMRRRLTWSRRYEDSKVSKKTACADVRSKKWVEYGWLVEPG